MIEPNVKMAKGRILLPQWAGGEYHQSRCTVRWRFVHDGARMSPVLLKAVDDARAATDGARAAGRRVALVPTMGGLHRGHLELVRAARSHAGGEKAFVVVSIFVNPTQFGPGEDFARYPRDLEGDVEKCAAADVDAVFAPAAAELYPPGEQTRVRLSALADPLCGEHRPGHFEGVATVVAKLFAIAGPCVAVFGRKDYQQLCVIERMARDLCFPVTVIGRPTVRDADGLALSSRNAYLSSDERRRALSIPAALSEACRSYAGGERGAAAMLGRARAAVVPAVDRVDYIALAHPVTLEITGEDTVIDGPVLLAVAVHIGTTRLIDNVVLGQDEPPLGPARAAQAILEATRKV
jgi:pantoate--beta-alanine ligase